MSPLNTADLQRIFASLDQNGDGVLSLDELSWLLERTRVSVNPKELVSLVGETGLNLDEFSHFCETMLNEGKNSARGNKSSLVEESEIPEEVHVEQEETELYRAFKVFDLNGDGLISSQELHSMWGTNGGLDCDRIMGKYDVNSDGFVDFEEFKTMVLAH
ncbi:hypothetical protein Cgig2_005946 [Carnegiea gigantea]|uniref:EF-hand domain-containing protein n=1 Tax=Carnegiea gigantea TaxID=171969 RepID=A0A9Q1KJ18_9CARY|nr:hypothetical protein Cgig2_005946 [Carnegiea gigantea]